MPSTQNSGQIVGLLGTGFMGLGMGARLLKAGFTLHVTAHRRRENVEALCALGAVEAVDSETVAAEADTLLLCLPDAETVEGTVETVLPRLKKGALIIDCSTTAPAVSRRIAEKLDAAGIFFVEAPLTGGAQQAADGVCGTLVGGSDEAVSLACPILESFCVSIEHFGDIGAGQAAKLLNNYMVIGIISLVTETFDKARAAGVDWEKLFEVARRGSGDNGVMHRFFPKAFSDDYSGYLFAVAAARKDLSYFTDWAKEVGGASPLAEEVLRSFEAHVAEGRGGLKVSELLAPENSIARALTQNDDRRSDNG